MRRDLRERVRAIGDAATRRAFEDLGSGALAEIAGLLGRIEEIERRLDPVSGDVGSEFTPVDAMSTVLTVSGTNGDGTYDAGTSIDFSTHVAAGAKKAYVQVVAAAASVASTTQPYGFRYKPSGYTDYIEHFSDRTTNNNVDEKLTCTFALASDLTGTVYCFKPDNGVGDAWSYTFKIWGYE